VLRRLPTVMFLLQPMFALLLKLLYLRLGSLRGDSKLSIAFA
jgi:hypothetical protein